MRRVRQRFAAGGYSRRVRPSRPVSVVVCIAALALPSPAAAHLRIATVAVGSAVRVAALPPGPRSAVVVRVRARDRAVELAVRPGHVVTALGYLGEPFLRIGSRGLWVDASSPTAAATGLVAAGAAGGWRLLRSGAATVEWRDARLQGAARRGRTVAWSMPLIVDGRRVAVRGTVRALPRPAAWAWLLLAALEAVGLLALARRLRRHPRAAVAVGAVPAAALVAVCVVFAADGAASPGLRIESVDEAAVALAGIAVLLLGGARARAVAAFGIGLVAIAAGATKGPVFLEGHVLALVPGTAARALVSLALATGAASALAFGGAALRERRESAPRPEAVRLPTRWG